MSASTKLSSSVKAICFLAESYPTAKTSKEIAENTGINASKLRKLLSLLCKSKIVVSNQGTKGGFQLLKSPKDINLQEIYCSIEDRKAFHLDVSDIIGKDEYDYLGYFNNLFSSIQVDIENKMTKISIQSIMNYLKMKSNF
ncbi:MAG: Rrf2 family transcriptional regulator [Bacteroidetes bacterium]|nr:Rrf2 family transcriptional regulator [Bacteroidota bacterium]MBU1115748.1 Rrf2 family transcriptional regulator [Bacteroidota bacterium]MBU1799464.1 Rrf2 family transcriptional regulator [Bacteroidota bacterium]